MIRVDEGEVGEGGENKASSDGGEAVSFNLDACICIFSLLLSCM